MLSAVILSALGYPAFTVGMITGTPEVRPSWSSRTRERSSQCSNAQTGYGPNYLTMFSTNIEVPNLPVDVDSWGSSACYPKSNFYPLSDGPSTRHRQITKVVPMRPRHETSMHYFSCSAGTDTDLTQSAMGHVTLNLCPCNLWDLQVT
jgi:hypothetical protein